jgi:hypothetical protein
MICYFETSTSIASDRWLNHWCLVVLGGAWWCLVVHNGARVVGVVLALVVVLEVAVSEVVVSVVAAAAVVAMVGQWLMVTPLVECTATLYAE